MPPETVFRATFYDKPQTKEKIKVATINQQDTTGNEFVIISFGKRKWDLILKHFDEIKAFFTEE